MCQDFSQKSRGIQLYRFETQVRVHPWYKAFASTRHRLEMSGSRSDLDFLYPPRSGNHAENALEGGRVGALRPQMQVGVAD